MKYRSKKNLRLCVLTLCLLLFCGAVSAVSAQQKTFAIILADDSQRTRTLADLAEPSITQTFRLSDPELVQDVIRSSSEKNLFNLSLASTRNIGTGIGCDYFLILTSENQRRSSFKKDTYYEAGVIAFFVDARSGRLLSWKYLNAEADAPDTADKALLLSFKEFAPEIPGVIAKASDVEKMKFFDTSVYEIKDDGTESLRTPLPFRRFSPTSTVLAQHLRVAAVVDIEVAIDIKGYITQTRIVRWAGLGLDEAVDEAVKKMNFRPAILDGKIVPARFLLRYNFRIPTEKSQ